MDGFDCLLDESFKNLSSESAVSVDLDSNENYTNIFPIIANRSGQLEELEISFEYTRHPIATVEKIWSFHSITEFSKSSDEPDSH